MRSIGIAALALLGLFLGIFLWLEFTTENSQEFMLSGGESGSSVPETGAISQENSNTSRKSPSKPPVIAEKLAPATENPPEPDEKPPEPGGKSSRNGDHPDKAAPDSSDTARSPAKKSPPGPLPNIGSDGSKPLRKFAAKTAKIDDLPKISVIVTNLGLGQAVTDAAIDNLPAYVSLAFSPYGLGLPELTARARAEGHEILVVVPMEPVEYPDRDPGDQALLTDLNAADNLARLKWIMSRFTGFVGIMGHMGSRFTGSAKAARPILEELNKRGLAYVDNANAPKSAAVTVANEIGLPSAVVTLRVDTDLSAGAIDARLAEAEEIAKRDGSAVVLGFPYPVTVDRIAVWITELGQRGIAAVPLTVLIKAGSRK